VAAGKARERPSADIVFDSEHWACQEQYCGSEKETGGGDESGRGHKAVVYGTGMKIGTAGVCWEITRGWSENQKPG
jgi:hypothetical protein